MDLRFLLRGRRFPIFFYVILIISITVVSYGLFFYLQYIIEKDTKDRLVGQQIQQQIKSTNEVSRHISSDLDSIAAVLHGLSNSVYLQQGDLSSDKTKKLMEETYSHINNITVVDRLFILDKNNMATLFLVPKGQNTPFFGSDNVSFEELVNQTRTTLLPVFTNGFGGIDREYRIAITYPIINRETNNYIGTIVALIPTVKFFEHYGNVHDINIGLPYSMILWNVAYNLAMDV